MTKSQTEKLVNYLSAFEFLYRADRHAVKSILTVYNFDHGTDHKAAQSFEQLAVKLVEEEGLLEEVVQQSKKLILDKTVQTEFLTRLKS